MDDRERACGDVFQRLEAGALSPPVALMELLIVTEDDGAVAAALEHRAGAAPSPHVEELLALFRSNRAGCARIAAMLRSGVDSPPRGASVEEGVAFCRRLFDWSVQQSEEASVALYSLGNPAILEAASRELATVLDAWGCLGAGRRALDVGCGIGRMELVLAPRLGAIHGIDVSKEMVSRARSRCASLRNATFSECTGLDLSDFEVGAFDLVLAVDSFPYLVQSGMPLVATHFAEAARVLAPGGDFVVLNFSYRDDVERDRADVRALAAASGFTLAVEGTRPFSLWNGVAFHMKSRP